MELHNALPLLWHGSRPALIVGQKAIFCFSTAIVYSPPSQHVLFYNAVIIIHLFLFFYTKHSWEIVFESHCIGEDKFEMSKQKWVCLGGYIYPSSACASRAINQGGFGEISSFVSLYGLHWNEKVSNFLHSIPTQGRHLANAYGMSLTAPLLITLLSALHHTE